MLVISPVRWLARSILPVTLLLIMTACAADQPAIPSPATATLLSETAPPTPCAQELLPPQIIEIQPPLPRPGERLKVIASGGLIIDRCGGYIEGAKTFKLYLDGEREPIGELSCYINHCESKLALSEAISTGSHCLSVEKDKCQFEFQVTAQ
jgi:hypothetical protein